MKRGTDRNEALYLLFEKNIILKLVTSNKRVSFPELDLTLADMAEFLANEG